MQRRFGNEFWVLAPLGLFFVFSESFAEQTPGWSSTLGPETSAPGETILQEGHTPDSPLEAGRSVPYQSGWPQGMGDSGTWPMGLAFADLDADGDLEVLAGSTTNKFFVFDHEGNVLPGWPVDTFGEVKAKCAVGDLDGDDDLEIVVTDKAGFITAYDRDGSILPGWPKSMGGCYTLVSSTLYDLDGDDIPEILWPVFSGIYAWRADGSLVEGFPIELGGNRVTGTLAVGNLIGDARPELVAISIDIDNDYRGSIRCYHADAAAAAGWPQDLGGVPGWGAPVMADLDGDGYREVIAGCQTTNGTRLWGFDRFGQLLDGFPLVTPSPSTISTPVVADVDGDGDLELFQSVKALGLDVYGWHHTGEMLAGWPVVNDPNLECTPGIANLDDDPDPELIVMNTRSVGVFYGHNFDGTPMDGFPLPAPAGVNATAPVIADIDGDGDVEVGFCGMFGLITIWDFEHAWTPESAYWPTHHHDNWNTNQFGFAPIRRSTSAVVTGPAISDLNIQAHPNPTDSATELRLGATRPGSWQVQVFGVGGRLVRDFGAIQVSGEERVVWDGRDDAGQLVPSGAYVVRARGVFSEDSSRLVVIR